jgi:hypothetical protein
MRRRALLPLALGLLMLATTAADAGILQRLRGKASVQRAGAVIPAIEGMALEEEDEVLTEEQAEILLQFDDGSRVAMRPSTQFKVHELPGPAWPERRAIKGRIMKGAIRYVSGKGTLSRNVRVFTPTSTIGVRGTDIDVSHVDGSASVDAGTYLRVNEGEAEITARDTSLTLSAGEVAVGVAPGLTARSIVRAPWARKITFPPAGVFQRGAMDELLR